MSAILIGIIAGIVCFLAVVTLKNKLGYDDSLDAFGVHGVGGTVGALATGLFASMAVNPAGADGLFFGNPRQFGIQVVATVVSAIFSFVATFIILKVIDLIIGIRVHEEDEIMGLDLSQHNETGYTF